MICPHCNAMRGYRVFGGPPHRPAIAWLKGVILPLAALPASVVGFAIKPTPLWFGIAALAIVAVVMGVRQLMSRPPWYRL